MKGSDNSSSEGVRAGGGAKPLQPSPYAISVDGSEPIAVPDLGLLLGRARACDVVLPDEDASRRHALLRVLGDSLWVVDEGSMNGTLVDGEAVSRRRLEKGAVVLLGNTRVEILEEEGGWPVELLAAWQRFLDAYGRRSMDAVEALRVLAAAEDCRAGSDGAIAINWADGERGMDGLGPMRMRLVQRALGLLAGSDEI